MKLRICLVILLTALIVVSAGAEDFAFTNAPEEMRPGKTERISFSAPAEGEAVLDLVDADGIQMAMIRHQIKVMPGINHLTWNGLDEEGQPIKEGEYFLRLSLNNQQTTFQVTLGKEAPRIEHISAPGVLVAGKPWTLEAQCSMAGMLEVRIQVNDQWQTLTQVAASEGNNVFSWDGKLNGAWIPSGDYTVQVRLSDEKGFVGTPQNISLILSDVPTPTPVPTATPAPTPYLPSRYTTQEQEDNYWTLPIGVMDEEKIWEIMMQPMTVIEGKQKETYKLRKTPDNSARRENIVGEITCASQGVHVLEHTDDGWTKVEAYNSSYGPDCDSRPGYGKTDELITGYVPTSLLKTIEPVDDNGLLIDKLNQTMYIFEHGKMTGTLLVSTGLPSDKQPWNETPAGEFVMISRTGGFPAGNLWCDYGMRINGGCLVHEVPYIGDEHTPASDRDYSSTVPMLGYKASHGCVRVQKAENEQGHSIKWLWKNIRVRTKVLIWDDTGRKIDYPPDDTPVYYNKDGGRYFHQDQNCYSVKDRYLPLTETTYGELENIFKNPKPCPHCSNIKTKEQIDEINHANGIY